MAPASTLLAQPKGYLKSYTPSELPFGHAPDRLSDYELIEGEDYELKDIIDGDPQAIVCGHCDAAPINAADWSQYNEEALKLELKKAWADGQCPENTFG